MKEINGIRVAHNAIDWTNCEIGRLKIKKLLGRHTSRKALVWLAECDCGKICEICSSDLAQGDVKSCGCFKEEVMNQKNKEFSDKYRTHGMSGSLEQKAWKRIKARCTNPKSKDYAVYSKIGISASFAENFMNFYKDIGPIPKNLSGRISVDRINNSLGYVEGNVRWANDTVQARNKGMYSNNSSGVNGVYLHRNKQGLEYWVASWYEANKKQKSKYFSVKKYGEELAFFAACELRSLMILRMNLQGAGYTENHGFKE